MPKEQKVIYETKFSRKIREYINLSEFSVYKISQITGLGRTAIQHTMSGALIPTEEFYEKLSSALRITPQQKNELTELYMKAKYGEKTYSDMKNIKDIIENLPQYYLSMEHETFAKTEAVTLNDGIITGIVNVTQTIMSMIEEELSKDNPHIAVTIPFENSQLFSILMQMRGIGEKKIVFEHFFRIYKSMSEESGGNNIEILKIALKLSMNMGIIYKPYYYYAYRETPDDSLPVYPYTVVTSEYAGMVSEDFKCMFLSSEDYLVKAAQSHIDKLRHKSKLMVEILDYFQTMEIAVGYSDIYSKSLEFEPCITRYLKPETVTERIKDIPEKDTILEIVGKSFFSPDKFEKAKSQKYFQIFDRRGIEDFAKTGEIKGLCGDLLNPLSINERIEILENIKKDVGTRCRMLDESKLTVPEYLQLVYMSNHSSVIAYHIENRQFCCVLTEQGICSAVEDFIKSLIEMNYVIDDNETVKVIDKCIENLENEMK